MFLRIALSIGILLGAASASATAILDASPTFVYFSTFGNPTLGQFQVVTIRNLSATETAQNIFLNSACFGSLSVMNSCYGSIAPLGLCSFEVSYQPNPIFSGPNSCSVTASGFNTNIVSVTIDAQ